MDFQIADLFEGVVAELGDERPALVAGGADPAGRRRFTYRELDERANRLAHHLASLGVGEGDRVGCHLFNGNEYGEAMLAAFKLRAVPVNLNYRYVAEELRYHFEDAEPAVVITEPDLAERVDEARAGTEWPGAVLTRGDEYEAALAASTPDRVDVGPRSADDLYLLYTGGTTGRPKGVMWRHEDLFFAALGGTGAPRQGIPRLSDPNDVGAWARTGMGIDRRLPLSPMMHGLGQWTLLLTVLSGGTCVVSTDRSFDAGDALTLIGDERVELVALIGDALARPLADELRRHPERYDLSGLRMITSSGAVLSPAVVADLAELLPSVKVMNRFGASETANQGRLIDRGDGEGPRLAADRSNVVLDDDLRPVEPGSGVIGRLATGGNVPFGYWRDPEKSATTFVEVDGGRYSVPGDLAMVEEDGSIVVLGRGSMVINSGGEKVFPEEVEAAVKSHPAVFDAVAVGVPDERFGERVCAVIQLREGAEEPTLDELRDHCRAHIAGYKAPRELVVADRVRRTPVGKPDYAWAKDHAASAVAEAP